MENIKILFIKPENEIAFVQNNAYSQKEEISYERCGCGDIVENITYDKEKLEGIEEVHIESRKNGNFAGKEYWFIRIYSVAYFDDVSVRLIPKDLLIFCDKIK